MLESTGAPDWHIAAHRATEDIYAKKMGDHNFEKSSKTRI